MEKICRLCGKVFVAKKKNYLYCDKSSSNCAKIVNILKKKLRMMNERCNDSTRHNYSSYKNVKVDNSWLKDPFLFVLWSLSNGWSKELQIDRIDNNKGYYPENCRYVTRIENARNKPKNRTDWIGKTRVCNMCNVRKPFIEFYKMKQDSVGIQAACKKCCHLRPRK